MEKQEILKVENLKVGYENECVLEDINFSVNSGELIAIVGPSGGGKSTLLRVLSGLLAPIDGTIFENISLKKNKKIEKTIVFQNDGLFPWLTVEKNLMLAVKQSFRHISKEQKKVMLDQILNQIELMEHRKKYPYQLSGGMKQRVAFARGMLMDAPLLLLDEPFSALDETMRTKLIGYLKADVEKNHRTVLMVTHHQEDARKYCDKILTVDRGRVAYA